MKWYTLAGLAFLASCSGSNNTPEPNSSTPLVADGDVNQPSFDEGQQFVNRDNHEAVVTAAFNALTGDSMQSRLAQIPYLPTAFGGNSNVDNLTEESFACANGGTATITTFTGDFSSTYDATYDNCQLGNDVFTGAVFVTDNGESIGYVSPAGLQAQFGAEASMVFSGSAKVSCCQSIYDQEWESEGLNFQLDESGRVLAIQDSESTFTDGVENNFRSAFLNGSLTLTSTASFNQTLTVTVDETFSFDSDAGLSQAELVALKSGWSFNQGKMTILATDGSSIVLDADSGDDSTVKVTVVSAQGSETFDQPWSVWQTALVAAN